MKQKTKLRLVLLFTAILAFFIPQFVQATDWSNFDLKGHFGGGGDHHVYYDESRGNMTIRITHYDTSGKDGWIDGCNLYIDGTRVMYIDAWWHDQESDKDWTYCSAKLKCYAYQSNIWIGNRRYGDKRPSTSEEDSWFREHGNKAYIDINFHVPRSMLGRTVTIKLEGRVIDGSKNEWFSTSTTQTCSFKAPTTSISNGQWNSDGTYSVKLDYIDGPNSNCKADFSIQTATKSGSWDDATKTGSYTEDRPYYGIGHTFYVNSQDLEESSGYNWVPQEDWSNGLQIRVKGKYYAEKYWCPNEYYEIYSNYVYTEGLTSFTDATLTKQNRNLILNWDVHHSTSSDYRTEGFQVDRYNGKEWVKLTDISYDRSKSNYKYTYTIPLIDCNKGNVDYKFRVWRKIFNNADIRSHYQTRTITKNINTDYKTLKFLLIEPQTDTINKKNEALVKWTAEENAGDIWDNNVKLKLIVTPESGSPTEYNVNYQAESQLIKGLLSCKYHTIKLETTVDGQPWKSTYYNIDGKNKGYLAPNTEVRTIRNYEVSKGYHNDYVMIKWEIPSDSSSFDYFGITRKSVKSGDEVQVVQLQHTGLNKYSYQDKGMSAGEIYVYTLEGYSKCAGLPVIGASESDFGFSQPYATASGRITYEGNVAVENATVAVIGDGENANNKSLYFTGKDDSSKVSIPTKVFDFNTGKTVTFQAWLNPTSFPSKYNTVLHTDNHLHDVYFTQGGVLSFNIFNKAHQTKTTFTKDEWKHVTLVTEFKDEGSSNSYTTTVYINGKKEGEYSSTNVEYTLKDKVKSVALGQSSASDPQTLYNGYIEEIRFWNIALDSTQIKNNYNAYLNGREKGLTAYYRCDAEGVNKLFDLSGYKGKYNKNDGEIGVMAIHSGIVPTSDQLANKTVTDHNGNYLISTIPYTSDGVQYNVMPIMGIHKFSPDKRPIFASPSSMTFNGVNFEDVSSFEVKGTVYYENTLYPVEGCELYVDGKICSRDGKMITTDEKGEYTISVPIGEHFIEVRKNGHVFAYEGRYPADPEGFGKRINFNQPRKNLNFYDQTKVTVVGRFCGGDVEYNKPLGLGESKANIGQAVLKLETGYKMNVYEKQDGQSFSFENDTVDLVYENSTHDVNCKAYVGHVTTGDDAKNVEIITILTDPKTGEFAVEMPPVKYSITKAYIPSNEKIVISKETLGDIDATEVLMEYTDSVQTENGYRRFTYNKDKKIPYHPDQPTFEVVGNSDGSFGEKTYEYQTLGMEKPDTLPLYKIDDEGKLTYTFSSPIFLQNKFYTFKLKAYEEYINQDNAENIIVDKVALPNTVVTITNQFAAGQKVYVEGDKDGQFVNGDKLEKNQLKLDENGQADYRFMAGFPNIIAPHTYGMNIIYNVNNRDYQWANNKDFKAIVLGGLASGSNFVTSGPDKILMILRDPSGTGSSAYFEKGTTISTIDNDGGSFITNNELTTITKLGADMSTITGTPGFGVVNDAEATCDLTVGAQLNIDITNTNETVLTTTTTERISTSDTEDYVGANGDLFIGTATNMIFGKARNVDIRKKEGKYEVNMEEGISVGQNFTTGFKFTQHHIENNLIPNLYLTRNGYIQHVESYDGIVNNTKEPIYVSTLSPEDPRFGSNNFDKKVWGKLASSKDSLGGPSYRMILPKDFREVKEYQDTLFQDMVRYNNTQIDLWTNTLANNEKAKVEAIENEGTWLKENHSFDAGAIIESSVTTTTAETHHFEYTVEEFMVVGAASGFEINSTGVAVTGQTTTGGREFGYNDDTNEESLTTGYILSESGYNDALTVDVYNAPDGFGAIFRNRGGQTSCPYEGATTTKYYRPGTEISTATMQVEIPDIKIVNAYATDVPAGKPANYRINLANLSETGDDVWFNLAVLDETNPDGAKITIDGSALVKDRPIMIPAGKILTKALQVTQTDQSVLNYKNIKIVLKSLCQGDPTGNFDVIADTISLSATFVPSCSDITLQIEDRVINTATGTTVPMIVKDFDMSFHSFKGVRLQYKGSHDVSWKLIKEYVKDEADLTKDNELLTSAKIMHQFDMSNTALYPDDEYMFRAITICEFGLEEVNNESEIITVIKDIARPMLLGNPSPANGILAADGEVSVTFNEDIKSSSLSEPVNFIVKGKLNGYKVDHGTALQFTGNEGASTQAGIDLSQGSFALNMWINVTEGGEILSHGNASNKFILKVNKGILTINFGGKTYTSTGVMPINKWVFLMISYDDEAKILSGYVAEDAKTITMFDNIAVKDYTGNGILTIGNNFKGSIHEMTLWNYARPLIEAQSQMYTSKAPKTPNLIGYWRMDEGHGKMAIDLVRNRHIGLSDANVWYIAAENKAVALDGKSYMSVNTTKCSPNINDDVMIEMWFNADKSNTGLATIFSTGLGFGVNMNKGQLELIGKEKDITLGNRTYNDNQWHHLAVNVLRNGMTSVLVDGEVIKQVSSAYIGRISSDHIVIGADRVHPQDNANTWNYVNNLKGSVDEFRMWNASVSADFIRANQFNRIEGTEAGLVAYYPFEKKTLDEAQQPIVLIDYTDKSATKSDEMIKQGVKESDVVPGLKAAQSMQNASFGFVASERKVVINLEEAADIIEGTTLQFTLREVKDVNDNMCQPIVWTAYVQRNLLKWAEDEIAIEKQNLESKNFKTTIINKSGTSESWTLSNMPLWLTADVENGTLDPLTEQDITFTVSEAMPIGTYEETVYLIGNNNIYEPFVVKVNVTGDTPEWSVNPEDFESSMNIVGQLKINGKYTENVNDKVAAFIGDQCVGVASPKYYKRFDAYFVLIDIYGKTTDHNKTIKFKVWDASTGNIYPAVETSKDVKFINNDVIGKMKEPFIWNATTMLEQPITLAQGWNWVSTYINTQDKAVDKVFKAVENDIEMVKDKTGFTSHSQSGWRGTLKDFTTNKMFKVNANKQTTLDLIGKAVKSSETPVTILPNWNWIGYNGSFNTTIADAFADLNPQNEDMVKSQRGFAIYTDYEWIGTLTTLAPGEGYMYMSNAKDKRTFTYPDNSSVRFYAPMRVIRNAASNFNTVDETKYSGNMTMIAIVKDGDKTIYNNEVGVFAGEECRGAAKSEEDGMLFITVAGEGYGDRLTIKVQKDNEIKEAKISLVYEDDAIKGTIDEPYIIQLGEQTAVENIFGDEVEIFVENGILNIEGAGEYRLFNAAGQLIYTGANKQMALPQGVYMIQIGEKTHKVVL